MNINGKYYTDTEAAAYIQSLLHMILDARSLLAARLGFFRRLQAAEQG